jgi:hypothetical protein
MDPADKLEIFVANVLGNKLSPYATSKFTFSKSGAAT